MTADILDRLRGNGEAWTFAEIIDEIERLRAGDAAALRKAKADGMREAAAMVHEPVCFHWDAYGAPHAANVLYDTIRSRAARVEQPR